MGFVKQDEDSSKVDDIDPLALFFFAEFFSGSEDFAWYSASSSGKQPHSESEGCSVPFVDRLMTISIVLFS